MQKIFGIIILMIGFVLIFYHGVSLGTAVLFVALSIITGKIIVTNPYFRNKKP